MERKEHDKVLAETKVSEKELGAEFGSKFKMMFPLSISN